MNEYTTYKREMVGRYWTYRDYLLQHGDDCQDWFDRPPTPTSRPPVFLPSKAYGNVIVDQGLSSDRRNTLYSLIPESDRHKWFRSMSSSQALAQSVFGNLAVCGLLDRLADLRADEGGLLFGTAQLTSGNFSMEHKVNHLGEPRPTSLDGYFCGPYRVAIECKLMETGVGTCSRPQLTPKASKYVSDYCNGTYKIQQGRSERCSLSQVGVLYWNYLPELFGWQSNSDLDPCPLNLNCQLVRNIRAVGTDLAGMPSATSGHAVLIYDTRNPAFRTGGVGLAAYDARRAALHNKDMLRRCSWQALVAHLRAQGVLSELMAQLEAKYGL